MKRTFPETLAALCNAAGPDYRNSNGSLNEAALARGAKINQATLWRMLNGQSKEPTGANADKLCKFFRVTRDQLLGKMPIPAIDGDGTMKPLSIPESDDYVAIPFKEVRLTAGLDSVDGFEIHYETDDTTQPLFYRRDWIEKHGYNENKLIARRVSGSSMEPALHGGDRVLVNLDAKSLKNGVVYMMVVEGQPVIKRLRKRGTEWWITSDNPAHSNSDLPLENSNQLIGEIVEKSSTHI